MDYAALDAALLARLNELRARPRGFLPALEAMLPRFQGKLYRRAGGAVTWVTVEGRAAVLEAVEALRAAPALGPLRACPLLARVAAEQARLLGEDAQPAGREEGLQALAGSALTWEGALGESVCFEEGDADDILAVLLVEDGNPARGHRRNLLRADFRLAGVATAAHGTLRHVAVLLLADEVAPAAEALPPPAFDATEMPAEAVSCSVKRSTRTVGGRRTVRTVRTYRMRDGSEEVVEELEEESVSAL